MTDAPNAIADAAPALLPVDGSEVGTSALEGIHVSHGVSLGTRLFFKDGQLATVSANASPSTLAEFDVLARALHEALGLGEPMECGSDEGVAFADYLASGHGSRRVEWRNAELFASLRLSPLIDGRLQLSAHAVWLPLQEPVDDFAELPQRGSTRAAKEDSTCEEANTSEQADFLGVPFGASLLQARTALGGELTHNGLQLPTQIGSVSGRAWMSFYDDCLASVAFVADRPSTENYRRLVQELQGSAPAMRLERCSPDGEPPSDALIAAGRGYLQARWEGPANGRVSLGHVSGRELVVEMEYVSLRGRAPNIDFAE